MQPVIIEDQAVIPASSTVENVIAANNSLKALQRLPFYSKLSMAGTQSNSGLTFSLDVGSTNVIYASSCRVAASSPELPGDVINGNFYGKQGDLLVLRAVNTTLAAITLRYKIMAEALAAPDEVVELPPDDIVMQQGPTSIAAAAVDVQLLNGLKYERPPQDAIMDLFMTMSATGLLRQVYIDQERVSPATTFSLLNRIPLDPYDLTLQGIEVPQDKEIQISVSNPTAGALTVFWKQVLHMLVRN